MSHIKKANQLAVLDEAAIRKSDLQYDFIESVTISVASGENINVAIRAAKMASGVVRVVTRVENGNLRVAFVNPQSIASARAIGLNVAESITNALVAHDEMLRRKAAEEAAELDSKPAPVGTEASPTQRYRNRQTGRSGPNID